VKAVSSHSIRSFWTFVPVALAWLCSAPQAGADVALAGRLTAPATGLQLDTGAQAPSVSPEGRFVAFASTSDDMGQPSNGSLNIYRYDLVDDTYLLATEALGTGNSTVPSISVNGLALAFESLANDLTPDVSSSQSDVFYSEALDDGQGGIVFDTVLVSRGLGGAAPNDASRYASISADARWVAFYSDASNLIAGDGNGAPDIFVWDAENRLSPPELVSVDSAEVQINGPSRPLSPSAISADGRYVAFAVDTPVSIDGSNAGTLEDVFVRDRVAGTTSLISKSTGGVAGGSSSDSPAISPGGRFVVFRSFSTNLVPNPTGSRIYLRDREQNVTVDMPLPPNALSCEDPRVSDYADVVAQCSMSGASQQVFLFKAAGLGDIYQLSTSLTAGAGNGASGNYSSISSNGVITVFDSSASDLVPDDTNSAPDVFVIVPEPGAAGAWLAAAAALAAVARRRSAR
jgi:Tol biopolymer transport system component